MTQTSTFKLPVLHTLDGAAAGTEPTILVDSREQEPLVCATFFLCLAAAAWLSRGQH